MSKNVLNIKLNITATSEVLLCSLKIQTVLYAKLPIYSLIFNYKN